MRLLGRSILTTLVVLALAVPVTAEEHTPEFRTEQTYFHCVGDVKVQNVAVVNGTIPSWDTDEPPGSVNDGEGCGFYDPLLAGRISGQPFADAIWEGTFTGNLRDLTIELHRLLPVAGVTLPNRIVLDLEVDGMARVAEADVDLQHEASETGASTTATFTVGGLGYDEEDGIGEKERTIRIIVASYNETQSGWVFDTTEVPAGITFNPESPEAVFVTAN